MTKSFTSVFLPEAKDKYQQADVWVLHLLQYLWPVVGSNELHLLHFIYLSKFSKILGVVEVLNHYTLCKYSDYSWFYIIYYLAHFFFLNLTAKKSISKYYF